MGKIRIEKEPPFPGFPTMIYEVEDYSGEPVATEPEGRDAEDMGAGATGVSYGPTPEDAGGAHEGGDEAGASQPEEDAKAADDADQATELQAGEDEGGEEGDSEPQPVELTDDTLVVDPADGQVKPWGELKQARQREAELARVAQEVEPYRGLIEFYRTQPEFARMVDELGKQFYAERVLGVKVADEDASGNQQQTEEFDVDDEALLEKPKETITKLVESKINKTLGTVENKVGQSVEQLVEQRIRESEINLVVNMLRASIGEQDWPAVQQRVMQKAQQLSPEEYSKINYTPELLHRFVMETHRELLAERQRATEQQVRRTKQTPAQAARAATSGANVTSPPERTGPKSWWDLDEDEFKKAVDKTIYG